MADGKDTGWVYYDPTSGGNGPPAGGKQWPTREGGGGARVSGQWTRSARDPGGGTVPTVYPRRMTIDEVSHVMELSGGGGGLSWSPPGFRQCGPRRPLLVGDTLGRECPHDDIGIRPRIGTVWMSVVPPRCYREPSSSEVSSCACTAC